MGWKLTAKAKDWEPLPGVPWRDMTEREFRAAAREYAERNQFPTRALHNSGFFEHVADGVPDDEPEEEEAS